LPSLNKPVSALRHGMKAVFYPFIGTAKIAAALIEGGVARDAQLPLVRLKEGAKRDQWHIAVFIALGLFSQSATLSDHELSQAGRHTRNEGATLIVNAFERDEYLFQVIQGKSVSEQEGKPHYSYLDYRDVFPNGIVRRDQNRTYWEMTWLAIERDVAERGQKLSRLVFQSHGLPGLICLYGENGELASAHSFNEMDPKDIFAPGAVIELRACSVGASFGGRLLAADLAKHYLRGGGQVLLSNVTIVRDYPETIYFQLGFPAEKVPTEWNGVTRFYLAGWSAVQYVIFSVAAEAPAPVRLPHARVSVFEFPAHPLGAQP
jgi:hypothetical protein